MFNFVSALSGRTGNSSESSRVSSRTRHSSSFCQKLYTHRADCSVCTVHCAVLLSLSRNLAQIFYQVAVSAIMTCQVATGGKGTLFQSLILSCKRFLRPLKLDRLHQSAPQPGTNFLLNSVYNQYRAGGMNCLNLAYSARLTA